MCFYVSCFSFQYVYCLYSINIYNYYDYRYHSLSNILLPLCPHSNFLFTETHNTQSLIKYRFIYFHYIFPLNFLSYMYTNPLFFHIIKSERFHGLNKLVSELLKSRTHIHPWITYRFVYGTVAHSFFISFIKLLIMLR